MPTPFPTPIAHLPINAIMPRRYVVHEHTQVCATCARQHKWSQTYAFNELRTRTGAGRNVINLVPIKAPEYNLPVELLRLPPETVAFCHECVSTLSLSHLPDPRNTEEWQRAYNIQPPEEKRSPVAAKASPKIEDFL